MHPIEVFSRTSTKSTIILTVMFNLLMAWLPNSSMQSINLISGNNIILDTIITCIAMTTIGTVCNTYFLRQAYNKNMPLTGYNYSPNLLLKHLPNKSWLWGLVLGLGFACIITPIGALIFILLNMYSISFWIFIIFKTIYTIIVTTIFPPLVIKHQAWVLINGTQKGEV